LALAGKAICYDLDVATRACNEMIEQCI
jgi:hypothetical protein